MLSWRRHCVPGVHLYSYGLCSHGNDTVWARAATASQTRSARTTRVACATVTTSLASAAITSRTPRLPIRLWPIWLWPMVVAYIVMALPPLRLHPILQGCVRRLRHLWRRRRNVHGVRWRGTLGLRVRWLWCVRQRYPTDGLDLWRVPQRPFEHLPHSNAKRHARAWHTCAPKHARPPACMPTRTHTHTQV